MTRKLALIGGGGHCRAVIDNIQRCGGYQIIGILDPNPSDVSSNGIPFIGDDDAIAGLVEQSVAMLITVGHVKSAKTRMQLAKQLQELEADCPTVVCPTAVVSPTASIGPGTVVLPNAVIGAGVRIGKHCIINSGAIVEHDSQVGDYCHVSTSATVNGGCAIGSSTFVGSGATVIGQIKVGSDCLIGAGSLVLRNVDSGQTIYGVPARSGET